MALHRTITVTEFRAKCLTLLDEVHERGLTITITKRGVPIAQLSPPPKPKKSTLRDSFAGRGKIIGDIVNFETTHLWEVLKPEVPKDL